MSVTARTSPVARATTDPMRRTARTAGILYVITFVSIPTLVLYAPVQQHVGAFVLGAGPDTGVLWGAVSEILVGLAGIGTAVVLFPVLKRQSETVALGVVASRILEASLIFVGVVSLLAMVSLRNAGTGTAGLVTTAQALLGVYNGAFLVSQSFVPIITDLLLGYVLYRSNLVPRVLPIVAFIGAPLLLAADLAVFLGAIGRLNPLAGVAALPIAAFELALGIWLIARGFNPASPVFAGSDGERGRSDPLDAPRG